MTSKFAKSGSPAVGVIKRWKWSANDQNFVANLIAGKHMDPEKAAESSGSRRTPERSRPGSASGLESH